MVSMEREIGRRQQMLPTTHDEVALDNAKAIDDHDSCVICLDSVSERAVASPCRHHNFDFLCLVSWLQERSTCPLCKTEVEAVEYDWQSSEEFKVYKVTPSTIQASYDHPARPRTERYRYEQWLRPTRSFQRRLRVRQPSSPNAVLLRRRQIYRDQLYSLHVGSNRLSRFRDLTPQLFSHDEELVSRARKWIRRELQVFEYLDPDGSGAEGVTRRANNAEFLLEYVVAILKTVDIKGSGGQAEDMLQEFLGRDNTKLFLHELGAWLRSPYVSLEDWDRNVQYSDMSRGDGIYHQEGGTIHHAERSRPSSRASRPRGDRYEPYNGASPTRLHRKSTDQNKITRTGDTNV